MKSKPIKRKNKQVVSSDNTSESTIPYGYLPVRTRFAIACKDCDFSLCIPYTLYNTVLKYAQFHSDKNNHNSVIFYDGSAIQVTKIVKPSKNRGNLDIDISKLNKSGKSETEQANQYKGVIVNDS